MPRLFGKLPIPARFGLPPLETIALMVLGRSAAATIAAAAPVLAPKYPILKFMFSNFWLSQ